MTWQGHHYPVLALVAAMLVPAEWLLPSMAALLVLAAGYVAAALFAWLFLRVTEARTLSCADGSRRGSEAWTIGRAVAMRPPPPPARPKRKRVQNHEAQ